MQEVAIEVTKITKLIDATPIVIILQQQLITIQQSTMILLVQSVKLPSYRQRPHHHHPLQDVLLEH